MNRTVSADVSSVTSTVETVCGCCASTFYASCVCISTGVHHTVGSGENTVTFANGGAVDDAADTAHVGGIASFVIANGIFALVTGVSGVSNARTRWSAFGIDGASSAV